MLYINKLVTFIIVIILLIIILFFIYFLHKYNKLQKNYSITQGSCYILQTGSNNKKIIKGEKMSMQDCYKNVNIVCPNQQTFCSLNNSLKIVKSKDNNYYAKITENKEYRRWMSEKLRYIKWIGKYKDDLGYKKLIDGGVRENLNTLKFENEIKRLFI